MGEINLDESKILIDIKESCIEFVIPEEKSNEQGNYETSIFVENLVDVNVGVRIKTTKKEIYAVLPSYLLLTPFSKSEIKIVYTRKCDENDTDLGKHKFKFEAILLEKDITSDNLKTHFSNLSNSKTKVQGTILKKRVYHKFTGGKEAAKPTPVQENKSFVESQSMNQSVFQSVNMDIEQNKVFKEKEKLVKNYEEASIYLMKMKNELNLKKQELDILKNSISMNSNPQSKFQLILLLLLIIF